MNIKYNLELFFDDKKELNFFYKLLKSEDFNFKNKNFHLNINLYENLINISSNLKSVLDLKIVSNATTKTLEVIEKINKNY
jgi:uncharacterized protein with ParB-like and HNH nuclease domain